MTYRSMIIAVAALAAPTLSAAPAAAQTTAEAEVVAVLDGYREALEMGWLPPSPDGIAMCQVVGVYSH